MHLNRHIIGVGSGKTAHFIVQYGLTIFFAHLFRILQCIAHTFPGWKIIVEHDNINKLSCPAGFCFENKNIAYTDIMLLIFAFHIPAEMSDNLPCFFLSVTEQFHIGALLIILYIRRLFIIPCHKIIGISRLICNIPKQETFLMADSFIQIVKILLAYVPAGWILQRFIYRLQSGFQHKPTPWKFILTEPKSHKNNWICGNTMFPRCLYKIFHIS